MRRSGGIHNQDLLIVLGLSAKSAKRLVVNMEAETVTSADFPFALMFSGKRVAGDIQVTVLGSQDEAIDENRPLHAILDLDGEYMNKPNDRHTRKSEAKMDTGFGWRFRI